MLARTCTLVALLSLAAQPLYARPVSSLPSGLANPVRLLPSDRTASRTFGWSVAVSGNKAIVGDPDERQGGRAPGAAYLLDISDPSNVRQTKITAFDSFGVSPHFGYDVDIDGDFAVVGARTDERYGFSAGAAYLLDLRDPTNIVQLRLAPAEVGASDVFGHSVAISGRRAIVGAFGDDDVGEGSGAAYVFDFSDLNNIVTKKIVPSDPLIQSLFGESVDIDGTKAIIGARASRDQRGTAYLYDLTDLNHIVESKLIPSDDRSMNEFGGAVALNGSFALIGAPQNNLGASSGATDGPGQAYLYDFSDPGAPREFKLFASDRERGDGYGEDLSLSDALALIGAPGEDERGESAGAVYAYDLSNLTQIKEQKVTAFEGDARDLFGLAVAVNGNSVLLAAPTQEPGGAAYFYRIPEPIGLHLSALAFALMAPSRLRRSTIHPSRVSMRTCSQPGRQIVNRVGTHDNARLANQFRRSEVMRSTLLALAVTGFFCEVLAAAEKEEGFRPLFNGKDTAGWHLRDSKGRNSWSVKEGFLKNAVSEGAHGTDLITDKKFWNFTVRYEYLVPENSNSGFYLRGRHELQILGDHDRGKTSLGGNGAIYNFKAPDKFVSRPGDEWQTAEATIIGDKITLVLNGKKVHDNVACDKPTGSELDDKIDEPGSIFLQGDHGTVSFRKMRIKELK